ncbi:MAG: CCA tRNA nucleotidyltransferase [Nitrososphaerota archaeon]|jgi:tRNA nucleotidyltransferase (CCA-adding enzyme)|nr:CCA tRNA nucleotidyltransferase [Nitrososphaerota archaeon]
MSTALEALNRQVLQKITPTSAEYHKVEVLSKQIEQKILEVCQQQNVDATVRVEGSIAKDTWIKTNPDIDVFIRLPVTISRQSLGEVGLTIAKIATKGLTNIFVERFAEHPYLQVIIDNLQIDIVPCYNAPLCEWQSATDRTPHHTNYINQHLTPKMRGEVRLLKQFMQGIGVYGAEIKIGGFSGYLCELLILTFGTFTQTVQAFANYTKRVIIDPEHHFLDKEKDFSLLFLEPLVVVDPVDKARNVASAVQSEKLYNFIATTRAFLQNPTENFFFPQKQLPLTIKKLSYCLNNRGDAVLLFLVTHGIQAVPDVLWGQLYKSQRSILKLLELNDYKVLRNTVWNNKTLNIFIFELEQQTIPNIKKHFGPPLERIDECKNFLAKYTKNNQVVAGPYIEDGKWTVELTRKNNNVTTLFREKLVDGGKNIGISELVVQAFKDNYTILTNYEIVKIYNENTDFRLFLTTFLSGKPFWLK